MQAVDMTRKFILTQIINTTFSKMLLNPSYKFFILLLGAPVNIVVFLIYLYRRKRDPYYSVMAQTKLELLATDYIDVLRSEVEEQLRKKQLFFKHHITTQ